MNASTLELVKDELAAELPGRKIGKLFQLSRNEIVIDLRLSGSRYLYVNFSPADPRGYLVSRRLRDLEKAATNPSPFLLGLKKRLSHGEIIAVVRRPGDRVIEFHITAEDELGTVQKYSLIAQMTGRSGNFFLTNEDGLIVDRARDTTGEGQHIGESYAPPVRTGTGAMETAGAADIAVSSSADSPSEALDTFYSNQLAEKRFAELARQASAKIAGEIKKREKLLGRLKDDLAAHGNADEWKRFGDLLLANVSTVRRDGGTAFVTDYFDEKTPEIAIDAEENLTTSELAEKYYRRYTKARNAAAEIATRIAKISGELSALSEREAEVIRAVAEMDSAALEAIVEGSRQRVPLRPRDRSAVSTSVARTFTSSDGFEILVGKKAKDNDVLTFKVAKSLDTWMHAADYPGSHVVIRNPNRKEIPRQTLIEAAQLAAFYSQGKSQTKAAVHYTLKKFVNKPKGAAPGLVSLASFKTLLVVPEFPAELDEKK